MHWAGSLQSITTDGVLGSWYAMLTDTISLFSFHYTHNSCTVPSLGAKSDVSWWVAVVSGHGGVPMSSAGEV